MRYTAVTGGVRPSKSGLIFVPHKQKCDDQTRVAKMMVMMMVVMMLMMTTRRLQAAPMSPII